MPRIVRDPGIVIPTSAEMDDVLYPGSLRRVQEILALPTACARLLPRQSRLPAHACVARRPRLACFRSSPPVQRPDAHLPPQMPLPELELARPLFRRVSPLHHTTPRT